MFENWEVHGMGTVENENCWISQNLMKNGKKVVSGVGCEEWHKVNFLSLEKYSE